MEHLSKRSMYSIHLNVCSLLPKVDKISYIDKLANGSIITLSKTRLTSTVLIYELETERSDFVRFNSFDT